MQANVAALRWWQQKLRESDQVFSDWVILMVMVLGPDLEDDGYGIGT